MQAKLVRDRYHNSLPLEYADQSPCYVQVQLEKPRLNWYSFKLGMSAYRLTTFVSNHSESIISIRVAAVS